MPTVTVNGKSANFSPDKRLVLAIKELGVNIGHRCGGKGKCTTCRVSFQAGESEFMTKAEYEKLIEKDLLGQVRLSCQMICAHDMELEALMTLESVEGWTDTGPEPTAKVEPQAAWFSEDALSGKDEVQG